MAFDKPLNHTHAGYSLLEVLVSILVISLLVSIMLPVLTHARAAGQRAVCANNLRQIGSAWQGYVQSNQDTFPLANQTPQWKYGGVNFRGVGGSITVLANDRPINPYFGSIDGSAVFKCPSDIGVWSAEISQARGTIGRSLLGEGGGQTCYQYFGNSYLANPYLLNSSLAGIDTQSRAISLHDIMTDTSRLLVVGDPIWSYVAAPTLDQAVYRAGVTLDASWHRAASSGSFLAADGSTRFVDFSDPTAKFSLRPRP